MKVRGKMNDIKEGTVQEGCIDEMGEGPVTIDRKNETRKTGYFSNWLEWRRENSGCYQIAVILMLVLTWILTIHFFSVSCCCTLISKLV